MDEAEVQLTVEKLLAMCVEKNLTREKVLSSVMSQATFADCWEAFVKWLLGQFDVGRAVNCQPIGTLGYGQALENPRAVMLELSDSFKSQYGLEFALDSRECPHGFTPGPTIKINYAAISKIADLEKKLVSSALQNVFELIGEALSNHPKAEVDLGVLGKFVATNRQVVFVPFAKTKNGHFHGKSTVKNLMQAGKTQQRELPPLERTPSNSTNEERQVNIVREKRVLPDPKAMSVEMLGAGLNPHARVHNYSKLANDPAKLMTTTFKKPPLANTRFPPVLDAFKRTIAAPVSASKQYLSPSVRIASNYNPLAKSLIIDPEIRSIRFMVLEPEKTLPANTNPILTMATKDGTIQAKGKDAPSLQKDYNWKRYSHYVLNEITTEVISPIRQYWIHNILDLVPVEWNMVPKEQVENMLDAMLNEINKDYYNACRKSILDYVLKDEDQRKRLGIEFNPDPPVDYGSEPYKGLEPSEEWQTNIMMARMLMSDNLSICSPATLGLQLLWAEYEDLLLVDIPSKYEVLTTEEFVERQNNRMEQVQNFLLQDWKESAVSIISEETKQMDKDQALKFFEAVSTLMSNQVRQLITDSFEAYLEFFRQFAIEEPPTPQTMMEDIPQLWPNAFLKVKMTSVDNKVIFSDDTKTVRKELIRVVKSLAEKSEKIPRPDSGVEGEQDPYLWSVPRDDEIIENAVSEIKPIVKKNLEVAGKSLEFYDKYLHVLSDKASIEVFVTQNHTREEYVELIEKYTSIEAEIRKECPIKIRLNMVEVDCSEINKLLRKECDEIVFLLINSILKSNFERGKAVYQKFEDINNQLVQKADSEEKLVEIESFKNTCRDTTIPNLFEEYNDVKEWYKMLYSYPYNISEEDLSSLKQCSFWVMKIWPTMQEVELRLQSERDSLVTQLKDYRKNFAEELNSIEHQIDKLKDNGDKVTVDDTNQNIAELKFKLQEAEEKMNTINRKEELLEWNPSEFSKLEEAKQTIKPYEELWGLVREVGKIDKETNNTNVKELDPDEIERDARKKLGTARSLFHQFKDKYPRPAEVADIIIKDLDVFIKKIPIMRIVSTEGLEQRHFDKISGILGTEFKIDEKTTFSKIDKIRGMLQEKQEELDEIAQAAAREYSNLKMLQKMEKDWEGICFELKHLPEVGTYILIGSSVELIETLLEEQTLTTQTMKGSPFAKVHEKRIEVWDEWLTRSASILDVWKKVQTLWSGLEPVFASADIQKQLYKEAAIFKEVDAQWHKTMDQVHRNTAVRTVTEIEGLLETLKYCHEKLEIVQRELNNYLEKKRLFFPRFFFLSNEELLSILKETKDPTRVQPHLKKCFEGIKSLEFDERKITAMISQEGEKVDLVRVIDTDQAEGAVERWLIEVEDCMIKSTREVIFQALNDYTKRERKEWVQLHKGQAVLNVNMTYWTRGAEEKMAQAGLQGLKEYYEQCNKLLIDVVELVRGDIPELVRCTLKALIVLDVHSRDVIEELVNKGIEEKNEFGWQAQMRYYWENENTTVRIINAELSYNYEYLGNSERLVITPLTDRCYRTLCGAVQLNYGGAPEGPAGTGKTETVKDLAKALARMCVVFNCSDGLDYVAMGKFFKGLAATGGWACLDEFNRIEPEVLSVVAQQLLLIQNAVREGRVEFEFEGSILNLKPTCNCFITMNPGYAGRSDLPDNLKALFRTVAMMVPDYSLIAENVLYSYGFREARPLAQKIVATYKLCSEQLSSQKHYDYGMRAVKSVLTAAGSLKRRYPDENESIIMLRSINDVNLAKFLSHDLPLFEGITSDLFPGVKLPVPDYADLLEALENQCKVLNLQFNDYFIMKVIQLYEMINVRHGLMVVGEPFAGKSCSIKVLAAALTECAQKGIMNENPVEIYTLNPKAVNRKQLYGMYDEMTKDWQDGVLAAGFKAFARDESMKRKWMHFDGPIDALWIEDMNTVLDDNKKLCLTSGEIVAMSQNMNLIFEPMDLAVASPATVSRCGMVYIEPEKLGWEPIFLSWKLNSLPKTFLDNEDLEVNFLVDWLVEPTLQQIKAKLKMIAPMMPQNLVVSLLRMFADSLKMFEDQEVFDSYEEKDRIKIIDGLFIFCMTWSLGGCVVSSDRRGFNIWLRRLLNGDVQEVKNKGKKITPNIPDSGSYYDYIFIPEKMEWKHWTEAEITDINAPIPNSLQPNEIIVATVDTVRYTYLLEKTIKASIPHLFCGNTGTGKTVYVKDVLMNKLDQNKYLNVEIGFSAQTSANQVQDTVDNKVDVKRGKGRYGPPPEKLCVVFVDDLNMPEKEYYGAQPPVEILRQFLDQGGWFDRKENTFKHIIDAKFVACMGPPGGGRTNITPRMMRHLSLISLADFDDDTLLRIFSSILQWFFAKNKFSEEVTKVENKIVQASRDVYKTATEKLLPTPLKSHYTFNLRDFAKVIMGICMSDPQNTKQTDEVVRLWCHEIFRVFGDRLVDDEDRLWLLSHVRESTKRIFGMNFDNIFSHLDFDKNGKVETLNEIRGLMFGYLLTPIGAPMKYKEMTDFQQLTANCEQALDMYNSSTTKPMDLVMFSFAIEHLCRVSRILNQPGGHALLIGVGGSGRQSITRLAAHMAEYDVVQIELTKNYGKAEWQEDLKEFLRKAGAVGNPTVFLFTDSQIKDNSFMEDINTLLNTGEVPGLYPHEEKVEICEKVRGAARSENKAPDGSLSQLYSYFVQRCKKMLHIVLCFSPIGEAFRTRLRMFPSLVNCCTIDWFSAWPEDALVSVARKFLSNVEMEETVKNSCVEMCQLFHKSTIEWSSKMLEQLRRHYYVTPTSYLQMITTFRSLLGEVRHQVLSEKQKFEIGYDQIIKTENSVEGMKQELIEEQPKLEEAQKETARKVEIVDKEKKEAEIKEEAFKEEEAVAKEAFEKAAEIKRECDASLAEVLPLLEKAKRDLDSLTNDEISKVKGSSNPPELVRKVMEAVCILLNETPPKKQNPETMKMEPQWWEASKKVLARADFLKTLKNYNTEDVTEKHVQALQKFKNDENFDPDYIRDKVSSAAAGLCNWVLAMERFFHVNRDVKPKQEAQRTAEAECKVLEENLTAKQAELKIAQDKVEALQTDLDQTIKRKDELEAKVDNCRKKLERARQLIDSLGGEKASWKEMSKKLAEDYIAVTGDVLLSSGMIAYLGPFTAAYRSQIVESWNTECKDKQVPCSETFSLQASLGDPVKIRSWNIDGLPKDSFSIENGIIVSKASRWPLMIDPESQANKWIKKMENKEGNLAVVKLTASNFLRMLENKIPFGHPVLIEDVGEELDPSLEPLLLKQVVKNSIKLGENNIEYHKHFRLYITTRMRNPHYLPELSTKVTLLNFMITPEGLADQMLVTVVAEEQPELARTKEKLIIQNAENQAKLKQIQEKILQLMSSAGNILDDDEAVQVLSESKVVGDQITEEQENARVTEEQIDNTRMEYKPFSDCMSLLFFCITDLGNIDPMYQYSLEFFNNLFVRSIRESEASEDLETRLNNLEKHFSRSLYKNICRSLFEKDRLLFAFNLTLKFMEYRNELDTAELRFLMTGGIGLDEKLPDKPDAFWVIDKMWAEICRLSDLPKFEGFYEDFRSNVKDWQMLFENSEPHNSEFPGKWESHLNSFERLLVIRCIRPDVVVSAIIEFIANSLGREFTENVPLELKSIYKDSNRASPLIFILSPGSDPLRSLQMFAESKRKKLETRSLGQGQGKYAEAMIQSALETGDWVLLMNCHLAESFMPRLEYLVQSISSEAKGPGKDFRLWLTSYPSPTFPVTLLQNGLKMTNEPPKGLKNNLFGSYMKDFISDQQFFNACKKEREWKKLLFGLCFFNAVIQERRLYGALGWNIPYEFSESDLRISVQQLQMFLNQYEKVPFEALKYLTGECNFGGRVTDDKDRRLILTLLDDYYTEKIFKDAYKFTELDAYYAPPNGEHQDYVDYIKSLPDYTPPEVYGFHPNANITKNQNEATSMFNAMLLIHSSGGGGGGGSSVESTVTKIAEGLLAEPPEILDEKLAQEKYKPTYGESMNTVLTQEILRFNNLSRTIIASLEDLLKAIKGQIPMSTAIETTLRTLFDGKVPKAWMGVSYPSLKPLGGYIADLKQRIEFFKNWLNHGQPVVFEISKFFFTQGFLTGSLQNYARKYTIPIDEIKFNYQVVQGEAERPEDGVLVRGMFLEGARWSAKNQMLAESKPKVLFSEAPMMWLKPAVQDEEFPHYSCPLYKTSERRGELSTTGHSTNFVMFFKLPSDKPQSHWIKRGVALLTQLDD